MARFVSPPVSEFDKLRQPLTAGERLVFEFFDKHLVEDWEIYIQPHLNGLRPDNHIESSPSFSIQLC